MEIKFRYTSSTYGAKFTSGDIIGVCLDLDNKTILFL